MSASKLHPNLYLGQERSSGYIARSEKPISASSPGWRGRIYLVGAGWYWLSGWVQNKAGGHMLSLRAQEMTDEQAEKFCIPKGGAKIIQLFSNNEDPTAPANVQEDIPF